MSQVTKLTLHSSANETANGNSVDFDGFNADGPGALYFDVTSVGGTSPTLDFVLQEKDPVSGKYFDSGVSITQMTGVSTQRVAITDLPGAIYRLTWTIGGTASPNFTFSASLVAKDRG